MDTEGGGEEAGIMAEMPRNFKNLRACLCCSLIKSFDQFVDHGCDNCAFLEMDGTPDVVQKCTTPYFEGMVGMIDPTSSWVARWQRIDAFKPGFYAVEMLGELPERYQNMCREVGMPLRGKSSKSS
jgi:transcription elongation factor SPT4